MTRTSLEAAIAHEFASQASGVPGGSDTRQRVRNLTVDRPTRTRRTRSWVLPTLAGATTAAVAITIAVVVVRPADHSADGTWPGIAATTACTDHNVTIAITAGHNTPAGSALARFTNTSAEPCTLAGYPSVLAQHGSETRATAKPTLAGPLGGVRDRSSPDDIALAPNASATSLIESNDGDGVAADCNTFDHLAVSLTPTSSRTVARIVMAVCNLQVHPYVTGADGSSPTVRSVTGKAHPATLLVHCGLKYAAFDGRTWKIAPPIPTWHRISVNGITTDNGHLAGTMTLTTPDRMIFILDDPNAAPRGTRFTFHPSDDRPPLCA